MSNKITTLRLTVSVLESELDDFIESDDEVLAASSSSSVSEVQSFH